MSQETVTTKIWKVTHRLAKIIASVLDKSMLEVFNEALLYYAKERNVLGRIDDSLKGEMNGENSSGKGLHDDDEAQSGG